MSKNPETYPGHAATPEQILYLADEYRKAAQLLLKLGRQGEPLSRAPYRLAAIQAIELYLNALLLHLKHEPSLIRGMQHDLSARTVRAIASGLRLRRRTAEHLSSITVTREYLVARYGPEMTTTTSQINRLSATLD